jgi:hypothetical protein
MSVPAWKAISRELVSLGDIDGAIAVLREAERDGDLRPLVELATLKWKRNEYPEADEYIREVARRVAPNDCGTHADLHWAYTLGVGEFDGYERQRLAFQHALIAAALDEHPYFKLSVAVHYRDGLNGVCEDWNAAECWFSLAAKSGDVDAISMFEKFARKRKRAKR